MKIHNIAPVYDKHSRILILGSFPSVKSREEQFFYAHPQNRFWKVLAAVWGSSTPKTVPEKKNLLLENGVALWDVVGSCEITGSSDASITDVVPNDLSQIFTAAEIQRVFCNGGKSYELYRRYLQPQTGREAEKLPSTSPANASWSLERLIREWEDKLRGVSRS